MIIWTGFGFLVIVLGIAGFAGTELTIESLLSDETYYQNNVWPKLVGTALASITIWFVGNYLNKATTNRELLDPKTGERVILHNGGGHSLFFIPMPYWAPIVLVGGIAIAIFTVK